MLLAKCPSMEKYYSFMQKTVVLMVKDRKNATVKTC